MPQSGPGAAAEADASGEKQLFRELSGAGLRTVQGEVAERAKRAQLLVIIISTLRF